MARKKRNTSDSEANEKPQESEESAAPPDADAPTSEGSEESQPPESTSPAESSDDAGDTSDPDPAMEESMRIHEEMRAEVERILGLDEHSDMSDLGSAVIALNQRYQNACTKVQDLEAKLSEFAHGVEIKEAGEPASGTWVGYVVRSASKAGFFRIGRKFSHTPTKIYFSDIDEKQRKLLEETPGKVLIKEKLYE